MAKSSVVILFVLALLCTVLAQNPQMPSFMPLFSTETGYDLSFDQNKLNERVLSWRDLATRTGSAPPEGVENCDPVGSYVVYREGASFPDETDIMQLNALQNRIRTQTINPTYRFLSQIPNSRIPMASAGDLSEVGRREMQELASRIKTRFPDFFRNPDVDLSRFDFQSTNASNSIESAVAFAKGLVGLDQICETLAAEGNVTVVCTENTRVNRFAVPTPTSAFIPNEDASMDPLLLPYNVNKRARCLAAVNKRRTAREMNSFRMGRESMQLKDRIAGKLTPPGARPWNISGDEVQLLAKMCGYHQALFNDKNTWCRLFEDRDLEVAEYERELQHYWDESYGFPLNSRVACPLINDTLEYFRMLTARGAGAGANLPSMKFKFTDGNTLMRLVSLLGIAKDPRMLTATNYAQSRNRQFRSAKMAPFSGNLALNLFRCNEAGGPFFNDQTHRVQVLLNEQPVNVTFCQDSFCNLLDFRRELLSQAGQCMVDKECNVAMGLAPGGGGRPGRPGSGAANLNPAHLLVALVAVIALKIGYAGL